MHGQGKVAIRQLNPRLWLPLYSHLTVCRLSIRAPQCQGGTYSSKEGHVHWVLEFFSLQRAHGPPLTARPNSLSMARKKTLKGFKNSWLEEREAF